MIFYIDHEYKCHANPAPGLREFSDERFDGKCSEYIEGYRYVPVGETYVENNIEYAGEQIFPWVDIRLLDAAQSEYERQLMEDMRQALGIMEVTV